MMMIIMIVRVSFFFFLLPLITWSPQEEAEYDRVGGFCLLLPLARNSSAGTQRRPQPDHRNDPHHLLQTRRSGSLYTASGSWHFGPRRVHVFSHSSARSRALTRPFLPPLCIIFTGHYIDKFRVLNVCCIPFHPVTLHYLKTDNLTILPASCETPSARWEMTDLKSSRRVTL